MFYTMPRQLALLGMYFTIREQLVLVASISLLRQPILLAAVLLRSFTPQLVLFIPPVNLTAARWSLGGRLVFAFTLATRYTS